MKRAVQSGGQVKAMGRIYSLAEREQLLKDLKAKRIADAEEAKHAVVQAAPTRPRIAIP